MAVKNKSNHASTPVPAQRRTEKEQTKARTPKIKRTPLVRHTARRIVLVIMLLIVLSMGTLVGLTIGWVDYKLDQLETIEFLENYRPWMPTRMFAGDQPGFMIADFFNEKQNRQQVPLSAMPQDLINAVVALEDSRYFSHFGISFPDFCRAAYVNVKASYDALSKAPAHSPSS